MARARKVPGLRPGRSLGVNARRITAVRLDEFLSWRAALDDASMVQELHDMRIAAKRLRYALEVFDVCFGLTKPLLKDLTAIQEALGDIHDLDVLTDLLRARLRSLEAADEGAAIAIMAQAGTRADRSEALRTHLSTEGREARRLGLLALIGEKTADRAALFAKFQRRWNAAALDDLALRLHRAIAVDPSSGDGSRAPEPRAPEPSPASNAAPTTAPTTIET